MFEKVQFETIYVEKLLEIRNDINKKLNETIKIYPLDNDNDIIIDNFNKLINLIQFIF